MRLLYVLITFGLVISSTCALAQRNNINDLSITDNKYFQNGSPYSGVAYNCYQSGQLKEEFSLMNGMLNGIYATYKIDDRYDKSKYIDTTLIVKKIILIEEVKLDILKLKKDSIRSLDSIWILEEELFGGRIFKQLESIEVLKRKEKEKKLNEKYLADKLNNKKEGFYNTYADVYKKFQDCTESLATYRFRLKAHNEWLVNEKNKPIYKNILGETFNYERGVQTGTHVVYTKSGDKEIEETLDNGKKNGPYKRYSGNKIVEEGNYVNNEKEGEWTTLNSSEKITQNYSKGKLNGSYKKYNSDDLLESGQFVEGLKNGEWKNFDYYGKLLEVKNYKSDKLDGAFKKYSGDVVIEEGTYSNALKSGEWKNFDNTGKLTLFQNYKLDKLDGAFKKYSGDVVIEEGTYSNGLMNGEWKFYYNSGKIKGSGKFSNSDGGNVGSTGIPINGREGMWVLYYENGKKSQESNYLYGKENGSFVSYYDSGNLKWQYNYKQGERDKETLTTKYYENGKREYEGYFDGKNWHGKLKTYREDGTLKIYEHYYDGKLGFRNFYREDGQTNEKSESYKNGEYWFSTYYDASGNKIEKEDSYSSNNNRSNSSYTKIMCNGRVMDRRYADNGKRLEINLTVLCPYCHDHIKRQWVTFTNGRKGDCDEREFECSDCGKICILKPCLIKTLDVDDEF